MGLESLLWLAMKLRKTLFETFFAIGRIAEQQYEDGMTRLIDDLRYSLSFNKLADELDKYYHLKDQNSAVKNDI